MTRIFHIATRAEWEAAQTAGEYTDAPFRATGILHCCRASQLSQVAELHFRDRKDLVLLHLDSDDISAPIRWHSYEGVEESFPHVLGPIPLSEVVEAVPFDPKAADTAM